MGDAASYIPGRGNRGKSLLLTFSAKPPGKPGGFAFPTRPCRDGLLCFMCGLNGGGSGYERDYPLGNY